MEENVLNLQQLFKIIKSRIVIILITALVCGTGTYLVSNLMITPRYTATASMYVFSNTSRTENSISQSELNASQELVNTYIVVLKSDNVLDQVINSLKINETPDSIRDALTASAIDGTEAFTISLSNKDPVLAQRIVNTIIDIAPKEIVRVVKAGGVEVIDYAKQPLEPSFPNVMLNTIIGALIGLVGVISVCILVVLYDTKVRDEDDLVQIFKIPVLGIIPTLVTQDNIPKKNGVY